MNNSMQDITRLCITNNYNNLVTLAAAAKTKAEIEIITTAIYDLYTSAKEFANLVVEAVDKIAAWTLVLKIEQIDIPLISSTIDELVEVVVAEVAPVRETAFVVGETYYARSIGDHNCIYQQRIVRRTAKSVWIVDAKDRAEDQTPVRRSISINNYGGAVEETIMPFGRYSMAACIGSNDNYKNLK